MLTRLARLLPKGVRHLIVQGIAKLAVGKITIAKMLREFGFEIGQNVIARMINIYPAAGSRADFAASLFVAQYRNTHYHYARKCRWPVPICAGRKRYVMRRVGRNVLCAVANASHHIEVR